MKHLLRSGLFVTVLFSASLLQAQSTDCADYGGTTLIGSTVCSSSVNAIVTVQNTQVGKSYQAYEGDRPIGASVISAGGTVILTLPINGLFGVGSHIIGLRSSSAICPATTFPGDTALVVVNDPSTSHLKVIGDTICEDAVSATVTIQNTKPGETIQLYLGSVAISEAIKSNGGDIVVTLPRGNLNTGKNDIYVKVTVVGCGSVYLNDFASVVVNAVPSYHFVATALSPICEGNPSAILIPNTSVNEVYSIYQGTELIENAKGTGAALSIPIPASKLAVGRNTFSVRVAVQGPKGCGTYEQQLSLIVVVNASLTIMFQLEKDTVIAYENDPFAEVIILSTVQGVVFGGVEAPLLIGSVLTSNTGRDTLKLPIGNEANQLTEGTHTLVIRALVNGCTLHEFKDTAIVIVKPSLLSGIESVTSQSKSKVWPNPFSSELHINVAKQLKLGRVRISDALGSTLHEQEIHSEEITIPSQWPSGIYYLEISGEDYKEQVKLVK